MGAKQLQPIQRMKHYDLELLEKFIRLTFGDTMTDEASTDGTNDSGVAKFSEHLAWSTIAYVKEAGTKDIDEKKCFGVRTYKTFLYHAQQDKALFFAPNTSCSRKGHKKDNNHLRYINVIATDIDESIEFYEVLQRASRAKLPPPTMINRTPSGGWHVYWVLKKRLKGWHKSNQALYSKIAKAIQVSMGGDPFAKSVSNYYRIPKDIHFYKEENRFTMLKFKNWYEKALETNYLVKESSKENLLNHPAIIALRKGVADGARNQAAFSLAKVFQYSAYTSADAYKEMKNWNKLNTPALTEKELKKCIKSAYNGDNRIPLNYIYEMTGIKINIGKIVAFRNHKKERTERKNSHFEEIIDDLLFYLKQNGDFLGSQKELVEELRESSGFKVKERSLKEVIKHIKTGLCADKIKVEVFGAGRGAKTKISLLETTKNDCDQENEAIENRYKSHCTPIVPQSVNQAENNLLCTPDVPQQLMFKGDCGQICTPTGVQKTKNLRRKSKKIEIESYSSNKVISMHRALSEEEIKTVQVPNKHYERLVGMASKMTGGPPLESGYQYIHEVHSENLLAVDTVGPCGYVGNRRPLQKNSELINRKEVFEDGNS